MPTLYFCQSCTALLGDSPRDSLQVEGGTCDNCLDTGPHIAGEFTEENSETLLAALRNDLGVEDEEDENAHE